MVSKWLHIEYLGGDPWILPIWAAVNRAISEGRTSPLSNDLRELGPYVSTRLDMLPQVFNRVEDECRSLYAAISAREPHHEFTESESGQAFAINDTLKFNLLIDLDSLLFELKSCCELMTKLFEKLYAHAGQALPCSSAGQTIRDVLLAGGMDVTWFAELNSYRNFFIHDAAPYFAVDLSRVDQGEYDLIIMKENLRSFIDQSKFVLLSSLYNMAKGFRDSKPIVQRHLIGLFEG